MRSPFTQLAPAAALAVVCAAGVGCARDPVRIAVVMGADGIAGAQVAADAVNAAGGIRGRALELVVVQSFETTARSALLVADSIAGESSIVAVIGHANSSASLAASQVYNEAGLVQVAPTSSAPLYRAAGAFSFRLVAGDEHQAEFMARELVRDGRRPRVAMLYVNDDYGRMLRAGLAVRLRAESVTVVYEAPFAERDDFTDVALLTRAIVASRPDVLLWIGRDRELRTLLPPLQQRMPTLAVLASDGIGSGCCNPTGRQVLAGVRYVRLVNPADTTPAFARMRGTYLQRFPTHDITDQAALTHDAVLLIAHALEAEGVSRVAVRRALERLGRSSPAFEGATGTFSFDDAGDPAPRYFMDVVPPFAQSAASAVGAR